MAAGPSVYVDMDEESEVEDPLDDAITINSDEEDEEETNEIEEEDEDEEEEEEEDEEEDEEDDGRSSVSVFSSDKLLCCIGYQSWWNCMTYLLQDSAESGRKRQGEAVDLPRAKKHNSGDTKVNL